MERCGGRRPTPWGVGLLIVLGSSVPAGAVWAAGDDGPGPTAPATQDVGASEGHARPAPVTVVALTTDHGHPTGAALDGLDDASDADVLTEPLQVPEFYVAAVTWDGGDDPGEIALRVLNGGTWTGWTALEPDDGADDGVDDGTRGGTEPYVVGGATGVQVRVSGADVLPAGLALHLVPADPVRDEDVVTTTADAAALAASRSAAAPQDASGPAEGSGPGDPGPGDGADDPDDPDGPDGGMLPVGVPEVISRAEWSADESLMTWDVHQHELRGAVVHHTAGTNDYTAEQSPRIVRGIYHYHAVTRDWGDIGYNVLVDKYGQVFEGRSGTLAAPYGWMPEGGHARGFNHGTLGISLLGDYSSVHAPQQALDTMAEVIAWEFSDAGIDPRASSGMVSPGTASRPAGQQLPTVFAHRDVGDTTCPGYNIYARMPAMLDTVAERVEALGGRELAFHLRHTADGGRAEVSTALGRAADTVLVGDWDGDGRDTPALRRGNTVHFYDSFDAVAPAEVVDYGRVTDTVLVGDWDGDGIDTLAVRRGNAYFVKNSVSGGNADVELTYGREADRVLVGDWDGDGVDTFAVRRGKEYFVKNSLRGGNADLEFSYGREEDLVLVGDWDGDGVDTFTVRRGRTYFRSDALVAGPADAVFDYGKVTDATFAGDWQGNGHDGIGVRRVG